MSKFVDGKYTLVLKESEDDTIHKYLDQSYQDILEKLNHFKLLNSCDYYMTEQCIEDPDCDCKCQTDAYLFQNENHQTVNLTMDISSGSKSTKISIYGTEFSLNQFIQRFKVDFPEFDYLLDFNLSESKSNEDNGLNHRYSGSDDLLPVENKEDETSYLELPILSNQGMKHTHTKRSVSKLHHPLLHSKWTSKTNSWGKDVHINHAGMYHDSTIKDLQKKVSKLKKKSELSESEKTSLRQMSFAIRAKKHWK